MNICIPIDAYEEDNCEEMNRLTYTKEQLPYISFLKYLENNINGLCTEYYKITKNTNITVDSTAELIAQDEMTSNTKKEENKDNDTKKNDVDTMFTSCEPDPHFLFSFAKWEIIVIGFVFFIGYSCICIYKS